MVVIRIPQFELPRPNLIDLYIARTYLRTLMFSVVGLMGLFYISTFLDKSDKLFKGQVTLEHAPRLFVVGNAAVSLLHHRHRRAVVSDRHHRPADEK